MGEQEEQAAQAERTRVLRETAEDMKGIEREGKMK